MTAITRELARFVAQSKCDALPAGDSGHAGFLRVYGRQLQCGRSIVNYGCPLVKQEGAHLNS